MSDHDWKKARDWATANGASTFGSPFIRDAVIAALKAQIARQEAEEAVERGHPIAEAIRRACAPITPKPGVTLYGQEVTDAAIAQVLLLVANEIEAEVETHD